MKKFIVILLSFFFVQSLLAQETRMWVGEKNGKVFSYPIDSIDKITYIKNTPTWIYNIMDVFSNQIIQYHGVLPANVTDTIKFDKDTLILADTIMFPQKYFIHGSTHNNAPLDSITFSAFKNDTNIVEIAGEDYKFWDCTSGYFLNGVLGYATWLGNRIYFSNPTGYFIIDSEFRILRDSIYCPTIATGICFSPDDSGIKFLEILQRITIATSLGYLREYTPEISEPKKILETVDSNISRAQYFSADSILYYSYGPSFSQSNQTPSDAGYYFYDINTKESFLILSYLSEIGPNEMVNGFDVSPDRKKLLIAVLRKNNSPLLIEYDFASGITDTLQISFDGYNSNWSLWVRYSHNGKKILYDLYPVGTFGSAFGVFSGSETGIIDRTTLSKKVIDTNPTTQWTWVTIFPQWSPDDKKIIYLASSISTEPAGYLGGFTIYVLKNF